MYCNIGGLWFVWESLTQSEGLIQSLNALGFTEQEEAKI